MKQIPIHDASATQLAEFATKNLGLDVNFRMGAAAIRAALSTAGYDETFITVEEPEAAPAPVSATADPAKPRKYVEVLIAAEDKPGGSDPVPVGLNGRVMWIERAKPQRIPLDYYRVLMDAKKKVYDPNPAGGLMPPREVPTYPATLLREVA